MYLTTVPVVLVVCVFDGTVDVFSSITYFVVFLRWLSVHLSMVSSVGTAEVRGLWQMDSVEDGPLLVSHHTPISM